MTDEERRKLVYRLRQTAIIRDIVGIEAAEAADEIERLAKDLHAAELEKRIVELEIKYDTPARLIEAAEIAEKYAEVDKACGAILITLAKAIRARAAEFNPNRRVAE